MTEKSNHNTLAILENTELKMDVVEWGQSYISDRDRISHIWGIRGYSQALVILHFLTG